MPHSPVAAYKPSFQIVKSDKDDNFTTAIAQNTWEDESLTGLKSNSGVLESVQIISKENLAWRLIFWATDGFFDNDVDVQKPLGVVEFAANDALTLTTGGQTRYLYYNAAAIPYRDDDAVIWAREDETQVSPEIHVSLFNSSAAAKTAGEDGELSVQIVVRLDEMDQPSSR